jgi:hypothetical protein
VEHRTRRKEATAEPAHRTRRKEAKAEPRPQAKRARCNHCMFQLPKPGIMQCDSTCYQRWWLLAPWNDMKGIEQRGCPPLAKHRSKGGRQASGPSHKAEGSQGRCNHCRCQLTKPGFEQCSRTRYQRLWPPAPWNDPKGAERQGRPPLAKHRSQGRRPASGTSHKAEGCWGGIRSKPSEHADLRSWIDLWSSLDRPLVEPGSTSGRARIDLWSSPPGCREIT